MRRKQKLLAACFLAALLLSTVFMLESRSKASTPPATNNETQRRLIVRSGTLFTKDGIPINLSRFDAYIDSQKSQQQNGSSGSDINGVTVHSGTAFIRGSDLGKMFAPHVPKDKITDLSIRTKNGELTIAGKMKSALPVHFELKGPVSLTPDGKLVLHEKSMDMDKLPMKGLADMLGMNPTSIAGNGSQKGIRGGKDELIVDPNLFWGMPVQGRLSAVKVTNSGLVLVYGAADKRTSQKPQQQASR